MDTEDIDLPIFPLALACVALGVPILLLLSAVSDLLIDTCADLEKKCSPSLKLIVKILRLFLLYLTAPITLAAILVALTTHYSLHPQHSAPAPVCSASRSAALPSPGRRSYHYHARSSGHLCFSGDHLF